MSTSWGRQINHNTRLRLALGLMLFAFVVILGHSVTKTLAADGGTDFHSYWYYGHFVRQGANPYRAFFAGEEPSLPVKYLDGVTTETLPIAQPDLARTPANTAPMVLLLSTFSFVSWTWAKVLWMLSNLLLTVAIPWLVIRLLPDGNAMGPTQKLLICFAFYGLQGTRIANWTGQTTLFVFSLMLGTLLTLEKNWLVPGVMLGFALSKYSLALPVFIFVLCRQKYRVVGASLTVQVVGLLTVSFLGKDSPALLLKDYSLMARRHTSLPGIHLASLFPPGSVLPYVVIFVGTLISGGLLWVWLSRFNEPSRSRNTLAGRQCSDQDSAVSFEKLHLLAILALWSLLVVYHRVYDTATVILFIALVVYGLARPGLWRLSRGKNALMIFLMVFVLVMCFPPSIMDFVLPQNLMPDWYQIVSNVTTLTLVLTLGLTIWLLYQIDGVSHKAC
jgi:hypothetical protein